MSRRPSAILALAACGGLALQGCRADRTPTELSRGPLAASVAPGDRAARHIVVFAAQRVPEGFAERVSSLGGAVEAGLDAIGVAAVAGLTDAAAAELAGDVGVLHVEPDVFVSTSHNEDAATGETPGESLAPADATASPTTAQFYARQWNLRAVFAPEAWAAGHQGSRDVVVAILDSGIDYLNPDLAGLVDLARSKSFVPEDDQVIGQRFPGRLSISDLHGHGTAAAAIVASNAVRVAGINRYVTLLAVKIWDRSATGSFANLLNGIVYAADQAADVINVSGDYTRDRSENPGLVAAIERAANYAFARGALVVSIAGNDAADLDHNGDLVRLPCETANALCASGTAPAGVAGVNGPWQDVDALAPYTDYGRSAVNVAAPSGFGDFANPNPAIGQFRRIWVPCTTTPTETSLPACRLGMALAQPFGTSWAAPHVAGLAALLVAQLGHGNPALIRARILESADDLGEPGVDPYYGHGRVNVARALGVIE